MERTFENLDNEATGEAAHIREVRNVAGDGGAAPGAGYVPGSR